MNEKEINESTHELQVSLNEATLRKERFLQQLMLILKLKPLLMK
jgi:hypothetical protein